MALRGIRGAVTVSNDSAEEVLKATRELLDAITIENELLISDIASVLFTVTSDIKSVFPAEAARTMGWDAVPLLCFQEIEVPGALPKCIRVLIHINTNKLQKDIKHVYIGEAKKLRKDLN
ncbi:Chorismate mutase II [Candidatus Syntrophocurvum alkaliphilum]|uniref:chorismate mutase n=1 Tax=Candidatus Syntrophocurvum alkaliphilum TaxID=2293317 RepID=A0A6I6DFL9_9FIRM|nr:chorismate mutase [Candidatus Syntrophocurvum alkaliphilum]QGT99867.1 Chorismate mutase II [Candidatus Syntrophocurvum alkaliphilum]